MRRRLKKVLSLVLCMAVMLSVMVVGAGAAFTDQDDIKYNIAVDTLVELGVINGYTDGSFKAANTVTRAEAAKMLAYVVAGADTKTIGYYDGTTKFEDVTSAYNWASGSINYCVGKGIIAGRSATTFDPSATVTGAELSKMLLVALGYKAETANKSETLVGENWQTNAIAMALKNGLYEGLDNDFIATQAANREEACQIIFNALKAETKEVALVIDDYYVYGADGEDLLAVAFGATATDTTDDFGRPATEYTNFKDKDIEDILIVEYADFTFTTAMEENELFNALGASGISGGSKYVVMDKIYQDGVQVAESEEYGNGTDYQATNSSDAAYAGSVIIAKGDKSNIAGFGNGVTVEIFETDDANHYIMVAYREYIGTVTAVKAADEDAGTERTITIAGAGTFETNDFAKQDTVLYTMDKTGVASVKAPTSISGKVTKITNGDTYTIDGVDYKLSQANTLNPNDDLKLNTTGTWFVDSCGNLIALDETEDADVYYGYLLKYEASTGADAGLLGDGAKTAGEKFKFVDDKGDIVVKDGAYKTDKNGDIEKFVASEISSDDVAALADDENDEIVNSISGEDFTGKENILFSYELNAKGEITDVTSVQDSGTEDEITKGAAYTKENTTYALTADTVFFYVDTQDEEYATYVGYANAPTKAGTAYYIVDDTDNVVEAIAIVVGDIAATSDEDYVYFASLDKTVVLDENSDQVVTYTDVYVNGVKGELKFEAVQESVEAGQMYTFTVNTKTEMATLGESNLLTQNVEITNVQGTYFVADSAFYTDADTIFYEIDEDNSTMTKVDALPKLSTNDAYDVFMKYVDGGADKDHAASVVIFVQK